MRNAAAFLVIASMLAGCARSLPVEPASTRLGAVAIVASPYEPAAQFGPGGASVAEGAVIGAAGGAGVGAMSAKASAGLLCTLGGPLCLIVMIPAAIVGGLIGGVAGAVVDAVTTDPGNHIAKARGEIEQAVAELRLTEALAVRTHARATQHGAAATRLEDLDHAALAAQGVSAALEVGVSELELLPRENEMALALRARSRLYRTADGALIDERISQAQTQFRKYQDWAADEARPLREAIDAAVAQLAEGIVSDQMGTDPISR